MNNSKVFISLDNVGKINNILYSHYDLPYVKYKNVKNLKQELKNINIELREYQNNHQCFESEEQLCSEIIYAQYKFIEGIQFLGNMKTPQTFGYIYSKNILYTDKYGKTTSVPDVEHMYDLIFEGLTNEGLAYYLFWRTKIINYEFIDYNSDCFAMLVDELIIGTIDASEKMFTFLKTIFGYHVTYILESVERDKLIIKNGIEYYLNNDNGSQVLGYNFLLLDKICNGDFKKSFEVLRVHTHYSVSTYFFKKYDLKDIYIDIFEETLGYISYWMNKYNYSFNELFVAKKKTYKLSHGSFCNSIIDRVIGNTEGLYEYDIASSNYEFRKLLFLSVENSFRKRINFKEVNNLEYQIDACCKSGDFETNREKLNDFIDDLIQSIETFVKEIIDKKYKEKFDSILISRKTNLVSKEMDLVLKKNNIQDKSKNPRALFLDCVKDTYSFENSIQLYETFRSTVKNNNKGFFYCLLFGVWVIDNESPDFKNLINHLEYDKEYKISRNALLSFDSIDALKYIKLQKNVFSTSLSKYVTSDFIDTCLAISYYLLYTLCLNNGLSCSELLLGKLNEYDWNVFGDYIDKSSINIEDGVYQKNLLDLETYKIYKTKASFVSKVIRPSYSDSSVSIIKFINTFIQKYFYSRFLLNTHSIKDIEINYDEFKKDEIVNIENTLNTFFEKLERLLDLITSVNISLNQSQLNNILLDNPISIRDENEIEFEIIKIFYGLDEIQYSDYPSIKINFNDNYEKYIIREKVGKKYITFPEYNLKHFYDNCTKYKDDINKIFNIDEELDKNFDVASSNLFIPKKLNFQHFLKFISQISNDNHVFQQWILRMEKGEIIIPQNKMYILLLYNYLINGFSITSKGLEWNLLILIQIWNYEYKDCQELDNTARYFLELINDYALIYCTDISLIELKSYLFYDICFEGEKDFSIYIGKYQHVDKELYNKDILQFYHNSMKYRYLKTNALKQSEEFKELLKESLYVVDKRLVELWKKYSRDFHKDFFNGEVLLEKKKSLLFKRIILLDETIDNINEINTINKKRFNNMSVYISKDKNHFDKEFSYYMIDYKPQYYLREYIFKNTEQSLRKLFNISSFFLFDNKQLWSYFKGELFEINIDKEIISKEIEKTVKEVYFNNQNKDLGLKIQSQAKTKTRFDSSAIPVKLNSHTISAKLFNNQIKTMELNLITEESLNNAEEILLKNENRLVLDDEEEMEIMDSIENDELESINFTSSEKNFLKVLLNHDQLSLSELKMREEEFSLIAERINEKALKMLDDIIIDKDRKCIFDEYTEFVEGMI